MAPERSCYSYASPPGASLEVPPFQYYIERPHASFDIHPPPSYISSPHASLVVNSSLPPSSGASVDKKKLNHARAAQACTECRVKKVRCDEGRPCQLCKEKKIVCHYQDLPPPKYTLTFRMITPTMLSLSEGISVVRTGLKDLYRDFRSCRDNVTDWNQISITSQTPFSQPLTTFLPPQAVAAGGWRVGHIDPAHTLFDKWPSLKNWSVGVDDVEKLSDYVKLLAQRHGLLNIWGAGERYDTHPTGPRTVAQDNDGGPGPDNRPDLRTGTLWKLYSSYIETIHKLLPFLNKDALSTMIASFSKDYSPDFKMTGTGGLMTDAVPLVAIDQGLKRKRGQGLRHDPRFANSTIEPSLRNAIILLVLALGEVCAHDKPLPAPRTDRTSQTNVPNNKQSKNIDILPGMRYYAYAVEILGREQAGNTLGHAQAMILAALYLNQFSRILESWSWISNACRVSYVLIKATDKSTRSVSWDHSATLPFKERSRHNLIKLVYWICLYLESELLAQMDTLTPSRITDLRRTVAYPDDVEDLILFFLVKAPSLQGD
ncbi:hypothetical protein T440DRAFT_546811 [Plenodomus tracheiphilus IPT5]|uniref:Zn(2)-C6 fungal-type domain-containing protein n=1 Tax=Plenodomus tracheiphilus IPT5 TaxID=1408161 RepID=A0A6A7ANT5_9PLEO|nr:hypothetical protein T440DRAFT_546811 [Plenodomus tracheiphilus IPT5]